MTIMRNYADDLPFSDWLFKKIMPVEETFSHELAHLSAMLGAIEMIETGTTTFMDMHMFKGVSCRVAKESGLRAIIGRSVVGEDLYGDGLSRLNEALEEQQEYSSDTIEFALSPHAIYTCGEKLLRQVGELAKEKNMLKHIHLSESDDEVENCIKAHGVRPVDYLMDLGFIDDKTVLAHCVKLNGDEISKIAKSGASVVTNPASNLKLGNGIAPCVEMVKSGVNLCIGTDSTASNNTLNLFREMGVFNLVQSTNTEKTSVISSQTIVDATTFNPAKAIGKSGVLGEIKEGALADLIMLDLNATSLYPNNNILSSLCNSSIGSEVNDVMVNGKWLMRDRKLLTIDKEKVLCELDKLWQKYM
jgi:5-methylthioadenosine/S-adenosylhomocysteine deaminase